MAASGAASLRAATAGRAAKERYEAGVEFDPDTFTAADHAALAGGWSWLIEVVGPATANGFDGLIDDEVAYVAPWGFDPAEVTAPTLLLHGGRDRVVPSAHGGWLGGRIPGAELRLSPTDGHVSVLDHAGAALGWLRERADGG